MKFSSFILFIYIVASNSFCLQAQSWPCPEADTIGPACTCSTIDTPTDTLLVLDCSAAQNEQELRDSLSGCATKFPFLAFEELRISHTGSESLTVLSEGAFCSLLSFKQINIQGTKLQTIQDNVFSASHQTLTDLNLAGNMLENFFFQAIGLYWKLESLNLARNALDSLPPFGSVSLSTIILDENRNLVFNDDIFLDFPNLQEIQMKMIDLESFGYFAFATPVLSTIDLLNNNIIRLPAGGIHSSSNSIKTGVFSNNGIYIIDQGFITGLSESASIEMMNNKIRTLDEAVWLEVVQEMNYTGTIDLSNNPLSCGCDIEWLVDNSEALGLFTATTTCENGTSILDLSPDYYDEMCS